MLPHVRVISVASALPDKRISSTRLEEEIRKNSSHIVLPSGIVEILTGVKERRVADLSTQASDLATEAARKAIDRAKITIKDIDCLIFASASGDIAEPATANIVQENLGATCPVLDVKNACNSFMNAIEIAEAFIKTKKYRYIVICNGEIPSRFIRRKVNGKEQLRRSFAGYTLGDAGAAMVLGPSTKDGILYSEFHSYGNHWRKSAVMGGGTRYPNDPEKNFFEGDTAGLKDIFIAIGPKQIYKTLDRVGWTLDSVDKIVVHQVSMKTFDLLVREAKLPKEKLVIVLPYLGNMVSASIPVALDQALQINEIHKGDKVLLLGLAAGVSVATMALIW